MERNDLSDKCAVVEVSYEPRLPSVEICAKRSLISNRCCRENMARRVIQTSHTLDVSSNSHTHTHTQGSNTQISVLRDAETIPSVCNVIKTFLFYFCAFTRNINLNDSKQRTSQHAAMLFSVTGTG